jgi:hypothetical protein
MVNQEGPLQILMRRILRGALGLRWYGLRFGRLLKGSSYRKKYAKREANWYR